MAKLVLFVAMVTCYAPQLASAGCHYGVEEQRILHAPPGGQFVENGLWATGRVERVYEDGRFFYYQVPGGELPCNGPNCGGSDSDDSVGSEPLIVPSRSPQWLQVRGFSVANVDCFQPFCSQDISLPGNPGIEGPLRPPRVSTLN